MTKLAVQFKNLSLKVGEQTILEDLNLEIKQGDFVYLLGANGAGKTTLLKAILGLDKSKPITKGSFGYVPQHNNIQRDFPITVEELIKLECELSVHQAKCLEPHAHLKHLNSEYLLKRRLSELSGGELQRVLIARALITDPEILVLDEPMNNLDQQTRVELTNLLKELNNKTTKTIILATHDHDIVDGQDVKKLLIENKKATWIS